VKAKQTVEGAHDALEDHEKMALEKADIKTIKIVSGGKGKEETEGEITKKELVTPKPKEEKKEPAKEETDEGEEW